LTRPNPIIVGLVSLTALVIGLEVRALLGARRHAPPAASDETSPPESPALARPVVVDQVPERPTPPPPPASPPPVTPAAATPPETFAALDAAADPPIAQTKRPLFVAPEPERVIRDADEQAFEMLHMPEATRAAIRKINDDHAEKQRAIQDGAPPPEGMQTRRDAIGQLLGVDAAHQFDAAERVATKRLRSRYRAESLHGVPPGSTVGQ
jgi:hypothetical protein